MEARSGKDSGSGSPTGLPIVDSAPAHLLLTSEALTSPRSLSRHSSSASRLSSSLFGPMGGVTPPIRGSWGLGRAGSLGGSNTSPGERGGGGSLELEAVAAVHELSFAVSAISVSEILPRTPELIFVNVTTLEGQANCLELTHKGWRVTSLRHDCMNGDIARIELHTKYFESPYALMDTISPGYRQKFSEALSYKLSQLSAASPTAAMAQTALVEEEAGKEADLSTPPSVLPKEKLLSAESASEGDGPIKVAVRHPSGEANQSFPTPPSHHSPVPKN